MSYQVVTGRSGTKTPLGYLIAGVATGLVVLWLVYAFLLTVTVTIDGKPRRLMSGSLVGDLYDRQLIAGKPGDLIAAKDHHVLQRLKGEAAYALVNGERVGPDTRLEGGDEIASHDGTDVIEPLGKRTEAIDAPVHYRGAGPVESVVASGKAGLREITFGTLSKQVVATRILVEPKARIVRRTSPNGQAMVIALTFDDGPWPGQTLAVLNILKKYGIKATFFQVGAAAKGRPELSRALVAAGMLIGNHTESHQILTKLSAAGVLDQIKTGENVITKASGQRPRYFRPPGGATTAAMWPVLTDLKLKLVQWDIDTNDWRKPGAAAIVNKVVNNARPGAVVLMHDGGGDRSQTIQALPQIIVRLQAKGYTFVTIDQLVSLPTKLG